MKQKRHSREEIVNLAKRLRPYVKGLSRKTKSKFTPYERRKIRESWKRLSSTIRAVERGEQKFVVSRSKKAKRIAYSTTNKGYFSPSIGPGQDTSLRGDWIQTNYGDRVEVIEKIPWESGLSVSNLGVWIDGRVAHHKHRLSVRGATFALVVNGGQTANTFSDFQLLKDESGKFFAWGESQADKFREAVTHIVITLHK